MLEFVLLGAAALWFVLWSRQRAPEKEEEKEEMLPVTAPVVFPGTNQPFSSPAGQESMVPLYPAEA